MIEVTLYTRKDCHLCEQVQKELQALQETIPHKLMLVDIDTDSRLARQYGEQIPVVQVGAFTLKAPIDQTDLKISLAAAQKSVEQTAARHRAEMEAYSRQGSITWTKADGFTRWTARHYLAVFNLFILIYLGLPILAPVFMKAGWEAPANLIYRLYGITCHQFAFRSWFLFGEQPVYPRLEAGVQGLIPYSTATGLPENDLIAARQFTGNDTLGFKIALCERDISIYLAILGFGLFYGLTRRRLPGLPIYLWVLMGLVPIGLDGVSQLLSQPPLSLIPYRESTPALRFVTGALFGLSTAWFGYPMVEESMRETRQILESKFSYLQERAKGNPA